MRKRFKIFLIYFLASLPFWWGVNILARDLEEIWFLKQISETPGVFTAQASGLVLKKEVSLQKENSIEVVADELEPETKSILSIEIDSQGNEKILFEKNSQDILAIASLSKIMTALVIFDLDETYDFSQKVEISKRAVEQEGASKYGELKEGESFSVDTLLHVMLIESSNDAAYALADLIGQDGFVEIMNLYAEKIGLSDTHFVDVTGLEFDNPEKAVNVSTCRDIAKLAIYVLNNHPQIFQITSQTSYEVFDFKGKLHHFIPENTNELIGEIKGIIGGKTGWSPEANGCLLLMIEKPEKNNYIINVILGADDRFEEMIKLIKLVS